MGSSANYDMENGEIVKSSPVAKSLLRTRSQADVLSSVRFRIIRNFLSNVRIVIFGTKLFVLFPAIPIAFVAHYYSFRRPWIFALSLIGLTPLAERRSFLTEQIAYFTGPPGAFGITYKGLFSNGVPLAVKVLNGTSDKRIEEQFMAEVSTMGRTHHFNLVRLYGFCFESNLRALVYEFMPNGSLDNHLFKASTGAVIGFEQLYEIALGTARGISYLHEDCPHKIIHYDIKPGNILLDSTFCAKVADFGLAKLCNRDNTHITMTGGRGTPGYAAPELWQPVPVSHKCDVYSFGILLFEIVGRRRNYMDEGLGDSQEYWFPKWVWGKYEKEELNDLMVVCGIEEKDHEAAERMLKVALLCVQFRPETRPTMSVVVKMLEGALLVPDTLNPFLHLFPSVNEADDSSARLASNGGGSDWSSSEVVTKKSSIVAETPLMRRYEITMASV